MSSELPDAQLDTDLLIEEVKVRPCLYARDHLRYGDVNYKRNEWENVTQILFANVWSKYDYIEKAEKVELVVKRWKNLRACFTREVKRQKDPNWIYGVAYKRRKYMYYNALAFLKSECEGTDEDAKQDIDLPLKTDSDNTIVTVDTNIEEIPIPVPLQVPNLKAKTKRIVIENTKSPSNSDNTKTPSNSDNTKTPSNSDNNKTPINSNKTQVPSNSDNTKTPSDSDNTKTPSNSENTNTLSNSDNLATPSNTKDNDQDSTNFALSLVPMLNMIPIDERIEAHIAILSVLQPFLKRVGNDGKKGRDVKRRRKSSKQKYGKRRMEHTISIELKSEAESDGEQPS